MPAAETAPQTPETPAQPEAPAPGAPPAAQEGVEEGEKAAEEKSDEEPGNVVCNCPADNIDDGKPPIVRAGGDDNVDVIYAEGDANAEAAGALGHVDAQAEVGAVRMEHAGTFGDNPVGGSHNLDVATAGAKFEGGIVNGAGLQAQADANAIKQSGSVFLGSDENNPLAEAGGEYALGSAEAKANALLGNDGTRRGVALGGGLQAAAAKGDVSGEINIPIPFTDWTIGGRAKVGGSAGSVGLGGNVQALQDLDTGRFHLGAAGEAALLLGLGLDIDLSIGPAYTDRDRPGG